MPTTRGPKPVGMMRFFLRMPIWLYRAGLGGLFGKRFVMIRHTGRKSGLPRYTVLEVVRHDATTNTYTIASGWGEKADWLQNIQQNPAVLLYTGSRRMAASAERLTVDAATVALQDYAGRYPTAFRNLATMMVGHALTASAADCRSLAQVVPLVMLHAKR